jgi:structural maintenance of chromosome 2
VTFDKGVNLRSVTVGGDVYDPSGQLSGGAKSQSSGCLLKMQCLKEMSKDLERAERELLDTVSKLQAYKIEKQNFMQLKSKKEMKEHEFGLLQKRMGNNPHFKVIQHVEKLIEDHTKSKEEIKALKENLVEIEQKIQKIEKEMSEFNDNREDKLEKLQKGINERKKLIKKLEPTVGKMKEEIMLAKEEGHQIVLEIERLKNGKKLLESEIEQIRNDELNLGKEVDQTQERYNGVNLIFLEEKKTLFRFDKELKSLELGLVEKTQGLEDKKLEATQIQVELEGVGNQAEQMKHKFEKLQKENKWIKDQKQYLLLTRLFGTSGTMYDFTTLDITESTKRISHLSKSYAELERKVDPTALEKYDR